MSFENSTIFFYFNQFDSFVHCDFIHLEIHLIDLPRIFVFLWLEFNSKIWITLTSLVFNYDVLIKTLKFNERLQTKGQIRSSQINRDIWLVFLKTRNDDDDKITQFEYKVNLKRFGNLMKT